ncbi:MAG: GerMN domain-containing protein [Clostridium sp.]|nr:GerMN domain-containing protein [Clostridium sp.]
MKNMKRYCAAFLMSAAMAFSMTACTPTQNNPLQQEAESVAEAERQTTPDGEVYETVDGAEEKLNMVVTEDPSVMVSVYTINDKANGLKQNMDAVDGEELTAEALLEMLITYKTVEEGVSIDTFENKDGAITLKLTDLEKKDDPLVLAAIGNTFLQNFEAETMDLYVDGTQVVDDMVFIKNYKEMK